jgi:nifR3 family TIM-barrel protein
MDKIRVGSVEFGPVIAGPMAGVSDQSYRKLARRFGAGLVYSEMISDMGLIYNQPGTWEMLEDFVKPDGPVSVQIFGSDAEAMYKASVIVSEHTACSIIDINMGCPTPKIVKNGEGSALMLKPDLAAEIVRAVIRGTNRPVTVKIRKGWDDAHLNAVEFARRMEDAGAAAIAVHGRTREQFYSGLADWQVIKAVKQAVSVPVFGNGDIWEPQDADRMIKETHCDAVMIARGALGNPWLFQRVSRYLGTGEVVPMPDPVERMRLAREHLTLAIADVGEYTGVREMRKHLAWYTKGLPGAATFREKINQATDPKALDSMLGEFASHLVRLSRN